MRYIQAALTLLGKENLLNSFDIEPVGMEGGNQPRPGGSSGLNRFRNVWWII